jgi:hypothetical protein
MLATAANGASAARRAARWPAVARLSAFGSACIRAWRAAPAAGPAMHR